MLTTDRVHNLKRDNHLRLLGNSDWIDYELIDSGNLKKLERFGPYRFVRPESQAMWKPRLPDNFWKSDGEFFSVQNPEVQGRWRLSDCVPQAWELHYKSLKFFARPTSFRHLGFFPEQAAHWEWCGDAIKNYRKIYKQTPRILNLFAYSGIGSLHAAAAGADVTHLDSSKKAIRYAFENRDLSGMADAPIRFITDDAKSFVERELRRGKTYDGIILDPPKYGRGPKGEIWKIDENLTQLLQGCRELLSNKALFVVLTIYAIRASSIAAHYALSDVLKGLGGRIESGELTLKESTMKRNSSNLEQRLISQANFARWIAL